MKLIIQAGNTGTVTLLNSNKIGTEPFGGLANYKHKIEDGDRAGQRTDSSKEFQKELANNSGSVVTVDRTIVLAKQSTVKLSNPIEGDREYEVFVDNIGGKKDIGKGHISAIFSKSNDGKYEVSNEKFIVEPNVSVAKLVELTNKLAQDGKISDEGIAELSEFSAIDAVSSVELFKLLKKSISDDVKAEKGFIKETAKIGVDFDDDRELTITDFRGVPFSDIELIEAVQVGYYNPEHYSKTENKIMEDMKNYLNDNDLSIDVHTVNTNFIDFGHDEVGNIVVNKNAKIKELQNGYIFKNFGLAKEVKDIDTATNNISNLLSPTRDEKTKNKIMQGIESLEEQVNGLGDKRVSAELSKIDIAKVVNSNKIADVSKEYNTLMDIAFSVKANILKNFMQDKNLIEPSLVKNGEGRIANTKFGYARERGVNLDGEQVIQRMAALHEIRPLTADGGVDAGMQVKSHKVVAMEYLFDKDDKLIDVTNAASLSNYSKTYNKLALVLEGVREGVSVKNGVNGEKRALNEKEFEQYMFKGKIYGKDEQGAPKYTGYGLKAIEDIFKSQASNETTGEAIAQFRKKIEAIAKESGTEAVQGYINESQDKLVKVFREFHDRAFPEFGRNKNIANTQYKNFALKDGQPTATRNALKALIGGMQPEALESEFDEAPAKDALSLVAKANYVKVVSKLAKEIEDKRLDAIFSQSEDKRKYDEVSYVASAIGRSEYSMKFGNTSYYDTNTHTTKLISPKTNFAGNTDKGILMKNEEGWNVLNPEVVRTVLSSAEESKRELAGVIGEIIKEQMGSFEKKTRISQGETATLNVAQREVPREEGKIEEKEYVEQAAQKEAEPIEEKEIVRQNAAAVSMSEEVNADTNNVIVTAETEVEQAIAEEKVENDIGIDLSLIDFDGEEEVEVQKASVLVKEIQAEERPTKAVGQNLLG